MLRAAAFSIFALALAASAAHAQDGDGPGTCRVMELEFTPSDDLQIVVWVETAAGEYVDTVFITEATGRYGLGNRPGRMDFNSGPLWPYGRRWTVAPVWAHRHGEVFPSVEFQNGDEDNLSHPLSQSSLESHYCRPLRDGEEQWDTETCASIVYTDKGKLVAEDSVYPPRSDVLKREVDHPDVSDFATMNPFDAVSRATPAGGLPFEVLWRLPTDLVDGDYVAFVEVSKEFDFNETYNPDAYPEPVGIPWSDYGIPYRGQPSVVYRVEFAIEGDRSGVYTTAEYAGFGDPSAVVETESGSTSIAVGGELSPPDGTITEGVDGSGASRLLLTPSDEVSDAFRVRVTARPSSDETAPAAVEQLEILDADATSVTVSFVAPGNDDMAGVVGGYDVRISTDGPVTADNFDGANIADFQAELVAGGSLQNLRLHDLSPNTRYFVAARAYDECLNLGDVISFEVITERTPNGTVSACGCQAGDDGTAPGLAALLALVGLALRRSRVERASPLRSDR